MRLPITICSLLLTQFTFAIERKPIEQIDIGALTSELQAMNSQQDSLDLIWWIPLQYWEASLKQFPEEQVEQILSALKNYTILAVIQADISAFGAFHFAEKQTVMDGMRVEVISAEGDVQTISHTEPADPDVRLLLDQMRPVLAQAMGNMGENFYFFPLPATDKDDRQYLSPYEEGKFRVALGREGGDIVFEIDTPVDALFVPRICPSGKPAHVSWIYCPWSGEKLPN